VRPVVAAAEWPTSSLEERTVGLLDGRTAAVTGAAQGIGLAIGRVFAAEGAAVVLGDVNEPGARKAAAGLESEGARALAVACDVTAEAEVEALVATAVDFGGSLDVMVNNAGITRDATMRTMSLADFRLVIDVHLQGAGSGPERRRR
jgi:3-oxoacyl-[acyl-carrier protein] reductase